MRTSSYESIFFGLEGMIKYIFIMPACQTHPDRGGVIPCQKHQIAYCHQCFKEGVSCNDPNLYCKFRSQCLINESQKERKYEEKQATGNRKEV